MTARHPNEGKTVEEILKGKRGSIKDAPLPEGAPSWDEILKKTWEEIEKGAREREPGYDVFRKLLTDRRFNK